MKDEVSEGTGTKSLVLQKREIPFSFIQAPQNLNGGFSDKKETGFKILKSVVIGATSGKRVITKSEHVFNSFIDKDFEKWDLESWEDARPKTKLLIYEIDEDVNFSQIFTKINSDLNQIILTQDQVVEFCEKHLKRINEDGCQVFFLTKKEEKYFVIGVSRTPTPSDLAVFVYQSCRDVTIYKKYCHRIIVPATPAQ